MSDAIKHECGIGHIRLLKPLEFYKKKYGSSFYGINKMYLLMEKQHNRGQDGAGFASIKLDVEPGKRFISRIRSTEKQPIQDVFSKINERINKELKSDPSLPENIEKLKSKVPYVGEVLLGHVRYGTFGGNSVENVHPFLRRNNWMHRNLILAGNFNMTNSKELFESLVEIGQHPKEYTDTVIIMEEIGHFLDNSVRKIRKDLKKIELSKDEISKKISKKLDIFKILKKASKKWDGGYVIGGLLGHGDSFVVRDPNGIRPAFYYKDDEVVVVASERPAIQTAFNVDINKINELNSGDAIVIKNNGEVTIKNVTKAKENKSCSFERIYFSRGNDASIYQERKELGKLIMPAVLKEIDFNIKNTVFSYIPNTAETSFYGMIESVEEYLASFRKSLMNVGFNTFDPTEGLKIPTQNQQILDNKVNKSYLSTSIGLAFRKLDVFGYYKFVTAVKNINLLPNRDSMIAQKKAKIFSNFAFKGVVGVVGAIYIILFGLSFWQISSLNKKLTDYDQIISEHQLKTLEKAKFAKELGIINKSLELSGSIESNKKISFRILAQIASSVPKRVKFNSIDFDGQNQVIINGVASTDQDILKLIGNLNEKKLISQASLASMTLPEGNDPTKPKMKGFKVACTVESI